MKKNSDSNLEEIDIKNRTYSCYGDIINTNDLKHDNILLHELIYFNK